MKKMNKLFLLFAFLVVSVSSQAQIKGIGSMLSGGTDDAQKVLQAYLKPYSNAFGADLNSSWYNTAKPHKLLGFDLTLSLNAAFVPSSDKTYDATKLNLSSAAHITGTSSQTVAGADKTGQTITYSQIVSGTTYKLAEYNTPSGTGVGVIPSPMIQLGIGLIKETDVMVRFVPTFNIGKYGSLGLWGVGLRHSIKQWIPGLKLAPFFNLSVFGGYTKMTTTANLSFQPSAYNDMLDPNPVDHTTPNKFNNQKMEVVFQGFTGDVLASFDLPVITFYAGVGFSKTTSTLKLKGYYPMPNLNGTQVEIIDGNPDPVNVKMSNSDGGSLKARLNGGIKFKMGIVTLHFDYTYASYSVVGTGLGFSFR